jgi:hypothetical protein
MRRIIFCIVLLFSATFTADASRVWTMEDGRTFEAEFVTLSVGKVLLRTVDGAQIRLPLKQFSEPDRKFVQLENPPELDISFFKTSDQRRYTPDLFGNELPSCFRYTFGAKVKQTSAGSYDHELKIELFAIGAEIHGNNYVLLNHQTHSFVPNQENSRSTRFSGQPVEVIDYQIQIYHRGREYSSFLVVVTDSRGKIIAYESPKKWLFENFDNLKQVPAGKCFDKTCTRVSPTRPKTNYY